MPIIVKMKSFTKVMDAVLQTPVQMTEPPQIGDEIEGFRLIKISSDTTLLFWEEVWNQPRRIETRPDTRKLRLALITRYATVSLRTDLSTFERPVMEIA